jgi:hypothetical protein
MADRYVVRRMVEREYGRDDIPHPAEQFVAAFESRAEAEEHARRLDREAGRDGLYVLYCPDWWTPFDRGFTNATTLPEYAFRDWLMDAGIDPPPPYQPPPPPELEGVSKREKQRMQREEEERDHIRHWQGWWASVVRAGRLTPEQVARVWEALNRVRFFEVVAVPAEGVPSQAEALYAVVQHCWEYNDNLYKGSNETLTIFRTRERADEVAAEWNRRPPPGHRSHWNGGGGPNEYIVVELQTPAEG